MATKITSGGSTLEEFIIDYNVESIKIDEYFLQQIIDATQNSSSGKLILNDDSILLKYLDEFEDAKETVTLTDQERSKYRYNPKLLAFDVYGTTELWFLILWANEMYSQTEFAILNNRVKLYNSNIYDKIERVFDLNSDIKKENADDNRAILQGE